MVICTTKTNRQAKNKQGKATHPVRSSSTQRMLKSEKIITFKNLSPFLLCILSYLFLLRVSVHCNMAEALLPPVHTRVYLGGRASTLPTESCHQPLCFMTGCHTAQDGFQSAENDFNFLTPPPKCQNYSPARPHPVTYQIFKAFLQLVGMWVKSKKRMALKFCKAQWTGAARRPWMAQ